MIELLCQKIIYVFITLISFLIVYDLLKKTKANNYQIKPYNYENFIGLNNDEDDKLSKCIKNPPYIPDNGKGCPRLIYPGNETCHDGVGLPPGKFGTMAPSLF